jgi:SAM-dependent methyltransferase
MEDLLAELQRLFENGGITSLALGSPTTKGPDSCRKIAGRSVTIRGVEMLQLEQFVGTQTTHLNLPMSEAAARIASLLVSQFRQAHIRATDSEVHILVHKNGQPTISRKKRASSAVPVVSASHDRQKAHLIPEGVPCPFLHLLGVMTAEGRVIADQRDKFRQINRFLDIVASMDLANGGADPLRIVDFGCGKAYLTFALHHYFTAIRKQPVDMVGVDLKPDVIVTDSRVAEEICAVGLRFEVGDILTGAAGEAADMVVALHACDTATDAALSRAVSMNARVILAAPCCQHELSKQLQSEPLSGMLKHGIIRERLTGIVTDSLRAAMLESLGYQTALIEFIDPVHTPKNILLRAVRTESAPGRIAAARREYETLRDFWHVSPALEKLVAAHDV